MSHYVNSYYSTDMDKFYTVYLSVIIVGKPTCVIPRDLRHTPSMAAYKTIRLKFELACKSSIFPLNWKFLRLHFWPYARFSQLKGPKWPNDKYAYDSSDVESPNGNEIYEQQYLVNK